MAPKLSVCLIAWNEEKNIARCLSSARFADEIIVVDNFSSDRTRDIAADFTPHVHQKRFEDYSDQKNFALSKASGEWVISLDADEEISDELRSEIQKVLSQNTPIAAYRIRRCSLIFGRWFVASGTQDDAPVRLFRREGARFTQPIHEVLETQGRIGVLSGVIRHFTYPSLSGYMTRLNRYTSMEAEKFLQENRLPRFGDLTLKPFVMFLRLYFWKQGFRDGMEGFMFCALSSFYVFLKHVKALERRLHAS